MLETGPYDDEHVQVDPFGIGKGHVTHGPGLRFALVRQMPTTSTLETFVSDWARCGVVRVDLDQNRYRERCIAMSFFGRLGAPLFLPHARADRCRRLGNRGTAERIAAGRTFGDPEIQGQVWSRLLLVA